MPDAQRLPRKYLSNIQHAQEDLQLVAQQVRRVSEMLDNPKFSKEAIYTVLREIESSAYRIALSLTELRVTDDCTGCPSVAPRSPAQIHLMETPDYWDIAISSSYSCIQIKPGKKHRTFQAGRC